MKLSLEQQLPVVIMSRQCPIVRTPVLVCPSMLFFFLLSKQTGDDRSFKGKCSKLKCSYCHNTGHLTDRCWQLHPELKPIFYNEQRGLQRRTNYKAHLTDSTLSTDNFTANPATLIQDFANYLQDKHNHGKMQSKITRTAGHE
jgi:hypothetical protein